MLDGVDLEEVWNVAGAAGDGASCTRAASAPEDLRALADLRRELSLELLDRA